MSGDDNSDSLSVVTHSQQRHMAELEVPTYFVGAYEDVHKPHIRKHGVEDSMKVGQKSRRSGGDVVSETPQYEKVPY